MQPISRVKKILIALIAVAVILAAFLVYALVTSSTSEVPTDASDAMQAQGTATPDMAALISRVFDVESTLLSYDWALSVNEQGIDQLTELSSMEIDGQIYDFLLTTQKADNADEEYTIVDYLTLTLTVANTEGGQDEIVFVDLEGDGALDSVYLNDEMLTSPETMLEAQDRYTVELLVAQDYLRGS